MSTPRPHVTDELLSAYLDGAASAEERLLVEQALAADATVAWRLETLRQTVSLVRALPQVALPASFSLEAILAAEGIAPAEPAGAPAALTPPPARPARAPWWQRWGDFWNSGSLGLRNAAAAAFALFHVVLVGAQAWEPQPAALPAPQTAAATAAAIVPATVEPSAPQLEAQTALPAPAALAMPAPAEPPAGETPPTEEPAQAKAVPGQPAVAATDLTAVEEAPPAADAQVTVAQESLGAAVAAAPELLPQGGSEAQTALDQAMVASAPPGAASPLSGAGGPGMGGGSGAPGMGGGGAGGAGEESAVAVAAIQAAEAAALRSAQEATPEPSVEPTTAPTAAPTASPTASPTATIALTATFTPLPTPTPAQVGLANPAAPAEGAGVAEEATSPPVGRIGAGLDWLTPAAIALGGLSLLLFGLWLLSRTRPGAR